MNRKMRSQIIRDVTWDAIVVVAIFEGVWFALQYAATNYFANSELEMFFHKYYLLIAIGMALVAVVFYGIC